MQQESHSVIKAVYTLYISFLFILFITAEEEKGREIEHTIITASHTKKKKKKKDSRSEHVEPSAMMTKDKMTVTW